MPLEALAPTNGSGSIPREIGALPLTRRAIAAMARFLPAETEEARDRVQAYCRLAEPERRALERLAENLARCGERGRWATPGENTVGFALAPARRLLLEGLALAARDLESFVRALGPMPNRGTELALLAELPARCTDREPDPAEEEGLPEIVPGFAMKSLVERLCVLMERKGLSLDAPVDAEQKIDLAHLLGVKPSTVTTLVSRARREQGIATPARPSALTVVRSKRAPGRPDQPPLPPAARPASPSGDLPAVRAPEPPPLPRVEAPAAASPPEPPPLRWRAERPVAPDPYLSRDPEGARAAISQLLGELVEVGFQQLALGPLEAPLRRLIAGEYPEIGGRP